MKNLNLQSACLKCGRPRCPLPSEVGWGQRVGPSPEQKGPVLTAGGQDTGRRPSRNGGLPWWLSGEEPACRCSRHGFNPGPGRSQHAVGQQSLSHNYWACAPCSPGARESSPRPPAREGSPHGNKDPAQPKEIN